jgi:hypothetical protein
MKEGSMGNFKVMRIVRTLESNGRKRASDGDNFNNQKIL